MKAVVILFAVLAMAYAQNQNGVNVVDGYTYSKNGVKVVDGPAQDSNGVPVIQNPDPGFYQAPRPYPNQYPGGSGVPIITNPDPGFYQEPRPQPGVPVIINPDPGFYQLPRPYPYPYQYYPGGSYGGLNNVDSGFYQGGPAVQPGNPNIDISPAYVENNYPAHLNQQRPQGLHPGARDGNRK